MKVEYIRQQAIQIRNAYPNMSASEICEALGIRIVRKPYGTKPGTVKGLFMRRSKIRVIVLNSDLPDRIQEIILFHELGHAVLHGRTNTACAFHDTAPFQEKSQCEYEANLFAAELALSDDNVLEQLSIEASFFGAASSLCVPPELLDFKFRIMNHMGYALNIPMVSNSNFMKNINRRQH